MKQLEKSRVAEAATGDVLSRKVYLKLFLQNSQETGKHLCQSFFLIKLQVEDCNFIKKETLTQVFSCEVCKIFKNTFLTEHLWATVSGVDQSRTC